MLPLRKSFENNDKGILDEQCSKMKRIRVPKVPFRFFDKLKYEIRHKVLIFVYILKLRHKT